MKKHKQKPIVPIVKESPKPTNADAIHTIADTITNNVMSNIDDGNLDTVEATGNIAMSVLLTQYAEGLLDDKQAFSFFKEMASKKTQAPIQRVEQHVKMDLRAVFNNITESNTAIQAHTLQQAKQHDSEVRERLRLDNDMMLSPREEDIQNQATFTVTPPPEIEDIRTGGDGSEQRQKWERQCGRSSATSTGATIPTYRKK